MITVENRVGRLVEARFVSPILDTEMEEFKHERARIMRALGRQRVVCVDLSQLILLSPTQADDFLEFLRGSRPGLTRNAFLLPAREAIVALQFSRIIQEAKNPARRAFRSREQLVAWLGETLEPPERARLEAFLARR